MSVNAVKVNKRSVSKVKTEKFTYQWAIEDFRYLLKKPGEYLDSSVFSFGSNGKINWYVRLYPNGHNKEFEGFLSLLLHWKHSSVIKGECWFSLINAEHKKQMEMSFLLEDKSIKYLGRGIPRYIARDQLLKNSSVYLPNDCLTIHCEIIVSINDVSPVIEKKQKLEVSPGPSWLENIFLEESFSDIKITATLCSKSLPAHRNVLAACSPVFKAMFIHNMQEQRLSQVKIEDTEYEVIKEMLRFIYLSKVENIEPIVFKLVKLAHMYQIADLVKLCEEAMFDQIVVDNVLKVITLADSYNMDQLKKHAIDFGSLHLKDVVKSEDFKSSTYPQAMQSVFEAFGQQ